MKGAALYVFEMLAALPTENAVQTEDCLEIAI
jgi:hypothetical protein